MFDVANRLLIVDAEGDSEVSRQEARISETQPARRAQRLAELGVHTLICGAISAPLEAMLVAANVQVIPHACGSAEQILRAFLAGRLAEDAFLMPGCCGRRRAYRGRHRHGGSRFDAQGDVA